MARRRRKAFRIYPHYRRPKSIGLLLVLALLAWGTVWRRTAPPDAPSGGDRQRYDQKMCTVVRVVDGDTLLVDIRDGKRPTTRVRLWGVDTPEIEGSPGGEMYFGPQASQFARDWAMGRTVRLALEPKRNTRDRYNRLLAYVYRTDTGEMLNARLVETGHAYADPRFPHVFADRFRQLERRAQRGKTGLWAAVRPEQFPAWRRRLEIDGAAIR